MDEWPEYIEDEEPDEFAEDEAAIAYLELALASAKASLACKRMAAAFKSVAASLRPLADARVLSEEYVKE